MEEKYECTCPGDTSDGVLFNECYQCHRPLYGIPKERKTMIFSRAVIQPISLDLKSGFTGQTYTAELKFDDKIMKNFRLKLPLPDAPVGTVGEKINTGVYLFGGLVYSVNKMLCNPDFFEEISLDENTNK